MGWCWLVSRYLLAAVLVLTVPLASGDWNQAGGDAGHTGLLDAPTAGPWDALARYRILEDGWLFLRVLGPVMVDTPYGPTGMARHNETDACRWVRITDVRLGTIEVHDPPDTFGCFMTAYSASHDLLLVCRADSIADTDLRAYDARTFEEVWRVTSEDIGVPQIPASGMACLLGALDEVTDELVVPWATSRTGGDYETHRITSIRLSDGSVRWSVIVPVWAVARSQFPNAFPTADGTALNWAPISATLTDTGVLVVGLSFCPDVVTCDDPTQEDAFLPLRYVAAWIDRLGRVQGAYWAEGDWGDAESGDAVDRYTGGTLVGTSVRNMAFSLVGDNLLGVDPGGVDIISLFPVGSLEGLPQNYAGHFGPAAWQDSVLLPLRRSVSAIDSETGAVRWQWGGFGSDWRGGRFVLAATSGGQVLAPASEELVDEVAFRPTETRFRVAVLSATDGQPEQILRFRPMLTTAYYEPSFAIVGSIAAGAAPPPGWILQSGNDMLYGHTLGDVVVLGQRAPSTWRPLHVSSLYPAPGEEVMVRLDRADYADAVGVAVNWESGAEPNQTWAADLEIFDLEHRFVEAGARDVLVTVRFADDTTTSRVLHLRVGDVPPNGPPDRLGMPSAESYYPGPNESVSVAFERPGADAVELFAAWGDGHTSRAAWTSATLTLEHAFEQPGAKDSVFTAVFLDGTTASRFVKFDVGGIPPEPPPALNFMQRAFLAENQDTTWGIVGILVVLVGGVAGFLGSRRRRGRLQREIKLLAAIHDVSKVDPVEALRQAGMYGRRIEGDLAAGRLKTPEYQVLLVRLNALKSRLNNQLLGPFVEKVDRAYAALLRATLEDGIISKDEAVMVRAGADRQRGLTGDDRETLDLLLDLSLDNPAARQE